MTPNPVLRAHKGRYFATDRLELFYYIVSPDGRYVVLSDFQLTQVEEHTDCEHVAKPIEIDAGAAQILMDDLWNCGVRPTEGAGSAGAIEAQRKHLEDIRQMLFAALKVEKP